MSDLLRARLPIPKTAREFCLLESIVRTLSGVITGSDPIFTGGAGIVDLPDIKASIEENVVGLRQSDGMPEIPLFVHSWRSWKPHITSQKWSRVLRPYFARFMIFSMEPPVEGYVWTVRYSNLEYPPTDLTVYQSFRKLYKMWLGHELGIFLSRSCRNGTSRLSVN